MIVESNASPATCWDGNITHSTPANLINDCLPSCDDSLTRFGGDFRTEVIHSVVIHLSFLNPFAIFTFCKPSIVGRKPISIMQKPYSPLLRANEEVNPSLCSSAFWEGSHHTFCIIAACMIKSLLELRLRHVVTASEVFPCFQILWAEKFEDSAISKLRIKSLEVYLLSLCFHSMTGVIIIHIPGWLIVDSHRVF